MRGGGASGGTLSGAIVPSVAIPWAIFNYQLSPRTLTRHRAMKVPQRTLPCDADHLLLTSRKAPIEQLRPASTKLIQPMRYKGVMITMKATTKVPTPPETNNQPTEIDLLEQIRRRAYELVYTSIWDGRSPRCILRILSGTDGKRRRC